MAMVSFDTSVRQMTKMFQQKMTEIFQQKSSSRCLTFIDSL